MTPMVRILAAICEEGHELSIVRHHVRSGNLPLEMSREEARELVKWANCGRCQREGRGVDVRVRIATEPVAEVKDVP